MLGPYSYFHHSLQSNNLEQVRRGLFLMSKSSNIFISLSIKATMLSGTYKPCMIWLNITFGFLTHNAPLSLLHSNWYLLLWYSLTWSNTGLHRGPFVLTSPLTKALCPRHSEDLLLHIFMYLLKYHLFCKTSPFHSMNICTCSQFSFSPYFILTYFCMLCIFSCNCLLIFFLLLLTKQKNPLLQLFLFLSLSLFWGVGGGLWQNRCALVS